MKHFIAKCTLSKTGISCELPSGHVYFLQIVGCTYLFSARLSSRNQQRCKRCHVQLKNKVVTHREKVLANDYWCKVEGSGLISTNWDSLTYIVCLIHEWSCIPLPLKYDHSSWESNSWPCAHQQNTAAGNLSYKMKNAAGNFKLGEGDEILVFKS